MAKTRLNQTHREILRSFAEQAVECPKEQKARDRAFSKAATAVHSCAVKAFPVAEMAVLKKYDGLYERAELRCATPEGKVLMFDFGDDPRRPDVPRRGYYDCQPIPVTPAAASAIEEYDLAAAALKSARDTKLTNYKALITVSVYFEDVLDVWPAAEAVADQVRRQQTALVALSADKIAAIRADNAGAAMLNAA